MKQTRREFLLQAGYACVGYVLGAAAFTAGVERFGLINALAQGSDYKALVCVFLAGGNDGNNGSCRPARRSTTRMRRCAVRRDLLFRKEVCCRSRRSASTVRSDSIRI
ncbi:MAG: hypothetical protein WKH64_11515 [Chloroflexia bacterium]